MGIPWDVKGQQRPTIVCQSISKRTDLVWMLLVRDTIHDLFSLHSDVLQIQTGGQKLVQTANGYNESQPDMEGIF